MINTIYPILILLIGGGGIFSGQKLLLLLAVVLLLLPVISILFVRYSARQLNIELSAPAVVSKGKIFEAKIEIRGMSRIPVGPVRMELVCSNSLTGLSVRRRFTGEKSFSLSEAYCGCLDLTLEKIKIYDWMGVFSVNYQGKCSRRTLVMPDTFPLEAAPEMAVSNLMDSDEHSPYRKGQDRSETFQIREYAPGDSLRQIHWKLSSKMDHLMVRDASLPVDPSLLLFWDKRTEGSDPAVCDAMCEAYVSMAHAFAEAGIAFRMAWNGDVIHTADITGSEHLPEVVADILKTEKADPALSGADLYLATTGNPEAGRILYLSDRILEDLVAFSGNSDLLLLVCGTEQTMAEETGEGIPVKGFTPETMEDELQYIFAD